MRNRLRAVVLAFCWSALIVGCVARPEPRTTPPPNADPADGGVAKPATATAPAKPAEVGKNPDRAKE